MSAAIELPAPAPLTDAERTELLFRWWDGLATKGDRKRLIRAGLLIPDPEACCRFRLTPEGGRALEAADRATWEGSEEEERAAG